MWPVLFNPATHDVQELEVIRHLRRETGRKDLFSYRHAETGNWGLAVWVPAKNGQKQFLDLGLATDPGSFGASQVQSIKQWARGKAYTARDAIKDIQSAERDQERQEADEMREATKAKRWLGNRLNHVQRTHPEWDHAGFRHSIRPVGG